MTGFSSREEAEGLASVIRLGYAEEGVFSERNSSAPSNDNDGWEIMDRFIKEAQLIQQDQQPLTERTIAELTPSA